MPLRPHHPRPPTWLAALALGLLAPTLATAATISFELTGSVGRVSDLDGVLGGQIGQGDPVTGTLTYDLATPDGDPGDTSFGSYVHPAPLGPVGLSITVNGLTFSSDPSQAFSVSVDVDTGQLRFVAGGGLGPFGLLGDLGLTNGDTRLDDDSLPTELGARFGSTKRTNVAFKTVGAQRVNLDLTITQFTLVPEPGSTALLGLGLVGIALARRRDAQ